MELFYEEIVIFLWSYLPCVQIKATVKRSVLLEYIFPHRN